MKLQLELLVTSREAILLRAQNSSRPLVDRVADPLLGGSPGKHREWLMGHSGSFMAYG